VYEIARKVKTQKVVIILGTGAGTPINGHHAAEISPLTAARAMGSEKIRAPLSCCFSVSLIVLTQRSGHSPPDKWRACSSFFFLPRPLRPGSHAGNGCAAPPPESPGPCFAGSHVGGATESASPAASDRDRTAVLSAIIGPYTAFVLAHALAGSG